MMVGSPFEILDL